MQGTALPTIDPDFSILNTALSTSLKHTLLELFNLMDSNIITEYKSTFSKLVFVERQ